MKYGFRVNGNRIKINDLILGRFDRDPFEKTILMNITYFHAIALLSVLFVLPSYIAFFNLHLI